MTHSLGKDLLGLEPLSGEQIRLILDTAEPFKEISERAIKKVPTLRGATIVNLFFEASTRTRVSFEFAEKRLSADTVNVAASGSSVTKGQSYGEVESVKAVSDVFAPMSGEVTEVNEALKETPENINDDPYGEGWMVRVRLSDPSEADSLMDVNAYKESLGR